jgi:hypothetical protein
MHTMKAKRICLSLTPPQAAAIRAEALRLEVSVSEIVRRVLDKERGAEPWDARTRRPEAPTQTAAEAAA